MVTGLGAFTSRVGLLKLAALASLLLLQMFAAQSRSLAQPTVTPPTLTKIEPASRIDLTNQNVTVTLTGTGFLAATGLRFAPADAMTYSGWHVASDTSAMVTLQIPDSAVAETVGIWVVGPNGNSAVLPFNTGIASSECLEALQTGECELLWEVAATSATGSSSQSNNNTTPNIMVSLDYQLRPPKSRPQKHFLANQLLARNSSFSSLRLRQYPNGKAKLLYFNKGLFREPDLSKRDEAAQVTAAGEVLKDAGLADPWQDHLSVHLNFKTGYTQTVTTTTLQPTSGSTCPGSAATPSCSAAIPQQAFVAEAAGKLGWNTGVNGQGTFADFGIGVRGSFDYLIPDDKVVQNGGVTYIDLSSTNPHNAVGLYEATAHFYLSQLKHARVLDTSDLHNASNLLAFEAGYQNNRGLQNLAVTPRVSTRDRYVARFTANPEINGKTHTKLTIGMEFSGGMNGGPHVIQLFFGTNLNPSKLFSAK